MLTNTHPGATFSSKVYGRVSYSCLHGWMLISVMLAVGEDERHGHGEGKDFRGID